jgi:hypothetical protein
MAEAQAVHEFGPPRRINRFVALAVAALILIGVVAVAVDHLFIESPQERAERVCIDKYNSFVRQAKSHLASGDRVGAINSLVAARVQLHQCETVSASSVSGVLQ